MKKYEAYKNSGIEWIGEIPEGWECTKLRYLLSSSLQYGASESGEFEKKEYPRYIRITDITDEGKLKEDGAKYLEDSLAEPYLLKKGDVLFARSGATVGKTYMFNEDIKACFAGYLIKASCSEQLNPKYLFFYTQSGIYDNWKKSVFSQATIQNIGADKYNELLVTLPSKNEQQAIASYLDHKVGQIDASVSAINSQIEDLKAYRQSIISEAVTKGLDKNVKMKDSGVEWIGEIPEGWDGIRLKFLCRISTGDKDTINRVDGGEYPFYVRSPKVERINTYSYDGEAILMAGDGVGAGKVFHYANGKFDYHQRVYNIHEVKQIKTRLLFYLMQSKFFNVLEQLNAKSTVDSVRINMLQDFFVPIPSPKDQERILYYLDTKTSKIDSAIKTLEAQREDLNALKQSIISEAVTGKIDVRDWNLKK